MAGKRCGGAVGGRLQGNTTTGLGNRRAMRIAGHTASAGCGGRCLGGLWAALPSAGFGVVLAGRLHCCVTAAGGKKEHATDVAMRQEQMAAQSLTTGGQSTHPRSPPLKAAPPPHPSLSQRA